MTCSAPATAKKTAIAVRPLAAAAGMLTAAAVVMITAHRSGSPPGGSWRGSYELLRFRTLVTGESPILRMLASDAERAAPGCLRVPLAPAVGWGSGALTADQAVARLRSKHACRRSQVRVACEYGLIRQ